MIETRPQYTKMMPGQEPYTQKEWDTLQILFEGACEAEELFSLDELERKREDNEI